jgi:glucose-6-phosphate 1-dehydrogenase
MDENTRLFDPTHAGLEQEKYCDPCIIVIFGASGDLTKRKLMPALFELYRNGNMAEGSKIIGFSRSFTDHFHFRQEMKKAIDEFGTEEQKNDIDWKDFSNSLHYIRADFNDSNSFLLLKKEIEKLESKGETCGNRLFYFATPPQFYITIIENLGKEHFNHPVNEDSWTRLIVEKPFGHDLDSAQKLNKKISRFFDENQVYRIDHYLGKETVQNLLVFRFGNSIFEPIWNRNYIDHIQITAAETIGIENRAGYYDKAGALRDMVQNHLLSIVSLIAMEPPVTFEADVVRDEKAHVLHAIQPFANEDVEKYVIRAQYGEGIIDGHETAGYTEEKGVSKDSITETYAALKLNIQNWRWAGVPFYLRTGKRLHKHSTEIKLIFRRTPHMIFRMMTKDTHISNILTIRIQPEESISLSFNAKHPGPGMKIEPVVMDFNYFDTFGTRAGNAYERLLRDCLSGDQTLYSRRDAVEASWSIVDTILNVWSTQNVKKIPIYSSGTWGPKEADKMMELDGKRWSPILRLTV